MSGSLDCIIGSMKSGKSSELLRRLSIDSEIGYKVLYINSSKDTRCLEGVPYSTHNPLFINGLCSENISSTSTLNLSDVQNIERYDVIGIDEAQFFEDLVENVLRMVELYNKKVIVAGLSSTYERKKFGKILDLEPYSDTFIKLNGLCEKCAPRKRASAIFTHKITKNGLIEDIGGKDKYMSLCRKCFLEMNS
jgi:thymidine kinase